MRPSKPRGKDGGSGYSRGYKHGVISTIVFLAIAASAVRLAEWVEPNPASLSSSAIVEAMYRPRFSIVNVIDVALFVFVVVLVIFAVTMFRAGGGTRG